jgi:hypothetical protein
LCWTLQVLLIKELMGARKKVWMRSANRSPNLHAGVGYDVLVDILCRTSPTHVVQLLSSSAKKNLPHGRFWDVSSKAKMLYLKSAVEESAKWAYLPLSVLHG